MSNEYKNHSGNGFFNGLVMGAVFGGACVFLFGTKKGKQVLKTLTENGLENFSDITEMFSDEDDSDSTDNKILKEEDKSPVKPLKRFFRGIKK